jgi:hypothetical protein
MLMVVFGAGASYDNAPGDIRGLPLAKDLLDREYDSIAAEYPASRAVIAAVREELSTTSTVGLERALSNFEAKAENSFVRQGQLVAFRFYLRELITRRTRTWLQQTSGYTYYLTLFNRLLDWQGESGEPIRLVTFNYDTLIEDALSTILPDWRFATDSDYITRHDWTLMKLHGSVTWCRVAEYAGSDETVNPDRAIEVANQLQFDQEAVLPFQTWTGTNQEAAPGKTYVPALAVPTEDKPRFECPRVHVDALRSCMPEVNRMLLCGWRAAETHALEILSEINPGYYLGIVAGNEPDLEEIQTNLGFAGRKGRLCLLGPNGMSGLASDMSQLDLVIRREW